MWIRLQKNMVVVAFLTIMLCVMELGLLTHAVGHIQDFTSHGSTSPNDQDKNTTAEHCQQCLGYAQADGVIVTLNLVFSLDFVPHAIEKIAVARLTSALTATYCARAPPFFLS